MANIHGMSDYNNNNNQGNQNPNQYLGQPQAPPVLDDESRSAVQMFGILTG